MLSFLTLPDLPLETPYTISWKFPEVTPSPYGYLVTQNIGFNFVIKTLELKYVKLTLTELNSLLVNFNDTDAEKLLQINLPDGITVKTLKPMNYSTSEENVIQANAYSKRYSLTFKVRIVQ